MHEVKEKFTIFVELRGASFFTSEKAAILGSLLRKQIITLILPSRINNSIKYKVLKGSVLKNMVFECAFV